MSIEQMKAYLALYPEGENSIPKRQQMLARQREKLPARQNELQKSLDFIDRKQQSFSSPLSSEKKS